MNPLLAETKLLDYNNDAIQTLIARQKWHSLEDVEKVKVIYNYVRDEILFGYNEADEMAASRVLADGYGQCNTKAILLMALLRAVGVENRLHGFMIDKALQRGAISGIAYALSPDTILHSWVEVKLGDSWYDLEGVIVDSAYLAGLQKMFPDEKGIFCGYGVYTDDFSNPPIDWHLNNTYIQNKGVIEDLGTFDTPDEFYAEHRQKLSAFKRFLYAKVVRHRINSRVDKMRHGK